MPRLADLLFFIYFATHIPITLLVDLQALLPPDVFPRKAVELKLWYCSHFRDAMMADPPGWFQSLVCCEMVLQMPFFFIAAYGFFKGAKSCPWLRLPSVVYGGHVATTLIPIFSHILQHDFTGDAHPGPRNMEERLTLLGFYAPYFFIPLALMLDGLFSSAWKQDAELSKKRR